MKDKRDMRDPESLGEVLLTFRQSAPKREKIGETYDKNHAQLLTVDNYDAQHLGPVEKYGEPGNIEPVYQEIRVR